MNSNRWRALVLVAYGMLGLLASVGRAHAQPEATLPALALRWEVVRSVFSPEFPHGRSMATLTVKNAGPQALPEQGWAIYFNCVAGVDLKPVDGAITLEWMSGTWYRLRPTSGFKGLGPQQSVQWTIMHPEVMVKTAKAPTGPYIVADAKPDMGQAIRDYNIVAFTHPEQWDHGPSDTAPLVSAQMAFEKNAKTLDLAREALPPVFPTPVSYERLTGTLEWRSMPRVTGEARLASQLVSAQKILRPYFDRDSTSPTEPGVQLSIGAVSGQSAPEAYELRVDPRSGVTLMGNTVQGVARGLQSLRDLLPLPVTQRKGIVLNALRVIDAPRFAYRGFQLDVARNFQTKTAVFRLLDLMARYKLNTFHFHLTDDEGWRIEIPGLPELTTVGGRRGHALDTRDHLQPAYGSGPDVADPYGSGFYSASDYIEIVQYAALRHIEVIPEIEMPGHARAAVKAMESRYHRLSSTDITAARKYLLSDLQDRSVYRSAQLYTDHLMNPGMPSTYTFVEKVMGEMVRLHRKAGVPLRTLHVGADELPNGAWEKSPATHALMQREKLTDTTQVWDYFYQRVDQMLRKHGLKAAGWEELGARKVKLRGVDKLIPNPVFVHKGFTLYVWNNLDDAEDLAYRMANAGYRTVLAPATHLYFDMAYNKNPDEPGVNWAAYTDLDTVFNFVPFDFVRSPGRDGLTDFGQKNIIGLEGTLFSETVRSSAGMDYLLMPRLLALAERAWAPDPAWAREVDKAKAQALHVQGWSVFANQLGKWVLPKLNAEMPGVRYRIAAPGLKIVEGKVLANHQTPGVALRYTTDATEPTLQSALVNGPIADKALIHVAAFDSAGRKGRSSKVDNR